METLRCPTCVALLPDPEARRCPLCHSKLRKKRRGSGAIVLGESGRLSGRSLPSEVEFHISRAEERILPDEKRLDEIVHDPTNVPHAPVAPAPVAPAPVAAAPLAPASASAKKTETVEAVLAFAPNEPVAEAPIIEKPIAEAPAIDVIAAAEPEPVIDLTPEPVAKPALDLEADRIDEPVHLGIHFEGC